MFSEEVGTGDQEDSDGPGVSEMKKAMNQQTEQTKELDRLPVWPSHSEPPVNFSKQTNFINRELSWLEFNERVLNEARDRKNPLMERLSFLSITQSNLDEFFMVRVASLKDQFNARYSKPDISGLMPDDQLEAICERTHVMTARMYSTFNRSLQPKLRKDGFFILRPHELDERQKKLVDDFFDDTVYPILTPMAVDSGRPFPLIYNRVLNLAVLLKEKDKDADKYMFSNIQVPNVVPRIFVLQREKLPKKMPKPVNEAKVEVILLEDIITMNLHKLFTGYEVLCSGIYRIMRNADLEIDEEEAADLLVEIEKQIRLRNWGEVIKLEIEEDIDQRILDLLFEELKVEARFIYSISGPLDLTFLNKFRSLPQCKKERELYYPDFEPRSVHMYKKRQAELAGTGEAAADVFSVIRQGDIFMYHPYESFDLVLEFIRKAARDPDVLAIKQTLYRISGNSPIIGYLAEAARNGKQVFVLVELKARFDEQNNIHWARALEKEGCHVIYGLVGLKTHSKITLVVRKEEDGIRRYVHLGTGNYNDQTARIYTDMGLFTCKESYGTDATEFFNMLSGFSEPEEWLKLAPAPFWLRNTFIGLIERETAHAREGREARIVAKMNSLVDEEISDALYRASQAGVEIRLIVRGICCLRPGVPGLSDNIEVRSLVGRYLEHARVYYFLNDGHEEYYMSSADWMPRNLDRRVELLFPVEDPQCIERVEEILQLQLNDDLRAHIGQPDGTYVKRQISRKTAMDSQIECCRIATERAAEWKRAMYESRTFNPATVPQTEIVIEDEEDDGGAI